MKVYVLTYNTADKPERRMIRGTFSTKEKANATRSELLSQYGSFCVDTEISEHELDN